MATKIVLNKKNSKDDFGILTIQSFKNNSKTKKSIGIKVSVDDFKNHFNHDFNAFNPKELRFKDINSQIKEALNNFENGVFEVLKRKKKNQSLIKVI